MYITYHGYCCFSIEGKDVNVITDPYHPDLGIKLPEVKADIATISHDGTDFVDSKVLPAETRIFDWPGEYEIRDVSLVATPSFRNTKDEDDLGENIVFVITIDGIRICHLGSIGCKIPNDQLEKIGDADILMIPIGGNGSIDAKKAVEVVEQIDPRLVIPMRYSLPGVKTELSPVNEFAKMLGHEQFETSEKFLVSKSQLPDDTTELVVLEPLHA